MSSATPSRAGARTQPRIAFQDVTMSFGRGEDRVVVMDELDFAVDDREVVCVIGPSGSGKTTLLSLAAGFLTPDAGQVVVDGKPVSGPSSDRGVVFQQYAVFPWLSVADNIGFGLTLRASRIPAQKRREIVDHYIQLMGLQGFADAYPKTLSGGMRQRVAIARAYAADPEILLMDEPFGALDAQTRDHMQEQLLSVMGEENKTVFFVTHSVEEAIFIADRVILLSPRPARVRREIQVPFDRPRERQVKASQEFTQLRLEVEELLRDSMSEPDHGSG